MCSCEVAESATSAPQCACVDAVGSPASSAHPHDAVSFDVGVAGWVLAMIPENGSDWWRSMACADAYLAATGRALPEGGRSVTWVPDRIRGQIERVLADRTSCTDRDGAGADWDELSRYFDHQLALLGAPGT